MEIPRLVWEERGEKKNRRFDHEKQPMNAALPGQAWSH
jgi:hypothetical protein